MPWQLGGRIHDVSADCNPAHSSGVIWGTMPDKDKKDKTGIRLEMALLIFVIVCIVIAAAKWFISLW
jgi:hypothetical protein